MIEIEWKCKCHASPQKLSIPARQENEPIGVYMIFLQRMIGHAHWKASPTCQSTTMEYVKIPMIEGKGIGEGATKS